MKIVRLAFMLAVLWTPAFAQSFPSRPDKYPSQLLLEQLNRGPGGAPSTLGPRPLISLALALIKDFEGWWPTPYNDARRFCTIGYGHLIAEAPCETLKAAGKLEEYSHPLTLKRGDEIIEQDTIRARLPIQKYLSPIVLTDEQFGALASFVFNVGEGNFASSTMLQLLLSHKVDLAAKEFRRWVLADGKELPGLVTRRACEEMLFRGNLKVAANEVFDRTICGGVAAAAPRDRGPLVDIQRGEGGTR